MEKFKPTIVWRRITLLALVTVILSSVNVWAQRPSGHWKQVYEDEVITESTLIINQDSVLFYNCIFRTISGSKYALELRNCTNSVIKDCKFYDIATDTSGNVIALRDSKNVTVDNCEIYDHRSEGHSGAIKMWGATSENITIQNNDIHDIAGNGIISGGRSGGDPLAPHDVPNLGLKVLNNRIVNVGLSPDLAGNSPKHGMYIKAMDPLIEGNYIEASHDGAGISVRSTGIVRNNFIINTKANGIVCSNMKPAGPSGKIVIENNVVVQKWEDTPGWASPLSAYFTDKYPVRYHTAIVRFNTVIGYPNISSSLNLMRIDDYGLRTNDQAYGNLLVDLRETPRFWRNEEEVEYRSNNYTRTNLSDFVDPANLDYRLKEESDLIDVITSESEELPITDHDGNAFVFPLEPGAHQYVANCQHQNIALEASIHSVSGEQTGNGSVHLIDGNSSNRWSAQAFPQWAIVDLGQPQNINEVHVVPYLNRDYQYKVFASHSLADLQSDNSSLLVLDKSGNTEPGEQQDKFNSRWVRYVKLLVTGASGYVGEWVSLHELRIIQPCESANPTFAEYWIEAECGVLGSLWDSKADAQASAGEYIEVKPGNNSSTVPSGVASYASFSVSIAEEGQYRLWGRVLSPSNADDSFWLRVDEGEWRLWYPGVNTSWTWRQRGSYDLASGDHTIDIAYREDGAKLDKLYLITGDSAPEGVGVATEGGCGTQAARIEDKQLGVEITARPEPETIFRTYPNPASETITISYPESYRVTLYDLEGRVVMQRQQLIGSTELSVQNLRSGTYVVEVVDTTHRKVHHRVIIE